MTYNSWDAIKPNQIFFPSRLIPLSPPHLLSFSSLSFSSCLFPLLTYLSLPIVSLLHNFSPLLSLLSHSSKTSLPTSLLSLSLSLLLFLSSPLLPFCLSIISLVSSFFCLDTFLYHFTSSSLLSLSFTISLFSFPSHSASFLPFPVVSFLFLFFFVSPTLPS